jgi:hypothetical protein|tara:strand:- start:1922 stop:2194 length:273 start_codon:yes stop_codon:yes gene_type:complete
MNKELNPETLYAVQLIKAGENPQRIRVGSPLYANLKELVGILIETGDSYSIARVPSQAKFKAIDDLNGIYTAINETHANFIPLEEAIRNA